MEALRAQREEDAIRLFEVLDVEKVFTQIIFARDMIRYASLSSSQSQTMTDSVVRSSHMAHMYDKVIEKLQ